MSLFISASTFANEISPSAQQAKTLTSRVIDVGVLATRGVVKARHRWQPTMVWLESRLPGTQFVLHPLTLNEMEAAVKNQDIDFVVTNPGQAVRLGRQYPLSWLATLNSAIGGGTTHVIGSALVVRAKSHYQTIEDVNGKTIAAVAKNAFGGYLAMRFEVYKLGIDPGNFFSNTRFSGFPIDSVIYQFRDKRFEAAVAPACLLEHMAKEGLINLSNFRVLNNIAPSGFSCAVSTLLYPNWSFAKTSRPSSKLAKSVVEALLNLPSDNPAAIASNSVGWTSPISQLAIDKLFQGLYMHPLRNPWWQEAIVWLKRNRQWSSALIILFVILNAYHFSLEYRFNRSNRKLEETLRRLKEKNIMLEHSQRLAIVGELGSSLAHEINQPLAAIRNYSQGGLLRIKKGEASEEMTPVLEKIQHQVIRADSIIQRLRALINKHSVEKSNCNFEGIITDTLELLEYDFSQKNISLSRSVRGYNHTLYADATGLQQVLLNILSNAADACLMREDDSSTHLINIETHYSPNQIILRVTDNGIGLTADSAPFKEVFHSTKSNGLGLGLAICRNIIESHNGIFSIQSYSPQGCQVTVNIPRQMRNNFQQG